MTIAQQTYRAAAPQTKLTPESPTDIAFRGGPPIVDKFDGERIVLPHEARQAELAGDPHWSIRHYPPVEVIGVPWGVALHLKERSIVPGTRDPYNGGKKALRRIGILRTVSGVYQDKPEACAPFTVEQLALFNTPEGLDRTAFLDARKDVTVLDTIASISHVGNVEQTLAEKPAKGEMAPTGDPIGIREAQAAEREHESHGGTSSRTQRGGVRRFKDDKE
jgi:hypothetical protein